MLLYVMKFMHQLTDVLDQSCNNLMLSPMTLYDRSPGTLKLCWQILFVGCLTTYKYTNIIFLLIIFQNDIKIDCCHLVYIYIMNI